MQVCLRSERRKRKSRGSHTGQSLTKVLPKAPMKYYLSQAAVQYLTMCVRHCLPASLLDCTAPYQIVNAKALFSLLHRQLPSLGTQHCSHNPHVPPAPSRPSFISIYQALECLGIHSDPLHPSKTKVCLMHMYVPNKEQITSADSKIKLVKFVTILVGNFFCLPTWKSSAW